MCDILFNLLYLFSFPYHLTQLILCSKLSYMPFVCLLHDIISCGKVETLMFPVHSESLKYNFCERTNCLTFRFYSFSAGLLSLGNRPTMEGDKHQPRASFSTSLSVFCRWKILISEFFLVFSLLWRSCQVLKLKNEGPRILLWGSINYWWSQCSGLFVYLSITKSGKHLVLGGAKFPNPVLFFFPH